MNYIFFDIDGVMTDGVKYYGGDGIPYAKTFFDKDFTALKIATAAGFKVVAVSGDERVNRKVITNRNIDFLHARSVSKWDVVTANYRIENDDLVVAVGDDIFDIELLRKASIPCCPINSHPEVLRYIQSRSDGIVTNAKGGGGVMVEIVDTLITKYELRIDYDYFFDLDKKEKF
jgi:YrbI family 3-deoxy-D-manno-octulosonate 8-phosphate phosphatase